VRLLCTVKTCHLPLAREARRYVCANAHSFDLARSGYVNLLQPQDRKSKAPGDTPQAVAARRRFLERGFVQPLVDGIVRALPMHADQALLDAGCGEGHHLAAFRAAYGVDAHGVDISVPAIDSAAKKYRHCSWIVANADRFLPWEDASFDAVTSITARLNAGEFRRVLREDGVLLVAIPGADDLVELRQAIQGERVERDRVERTIDMFASLFAFEKQLALRHVAHLDREAMHDVLASSYRGLRRSESEKLARLEPLDVTLSRDVLLFRPRPASNA
jgi:23S rRNA (guanine745-N1)-methyltransferase